MVRWRVVGELGQLVAVGDQPRRAPQHPQTFAAGRRRQPGAHSRRLLEPAEMLHQAQPGALDHVGRIPVAQPVRARHRPHQATELVDEPVPRALVAGRRALDEPADRDGRLASVDGLRPRQRVFPRTPPWA